MKSNHCQICKQSLVLLLTVLLVFISTVPPQAQIARRPTAVPALEEEKGDLSALHYASRQRRSVTAQEDDEHGEEATSKLGAGHPSLAWEREIASRPAMPHWNSPAGRAAVADLLTIDLPGLPNEAKSQPLQQQALAFQSLGACTAPTITLPGSKCCDYGIQDQLTNQNITYRQPYHVFTTGVDLLREGAALGFAGTVRASLPMYLPYKNSHVALGQGWIYNNGAFHGAVDYERDNAQDGVDPSFGVYAVADGKVVSVLWDNLLGNTIVIEHKAPNGDRYRTVYNHLRNGFDNDRAAALAIPLVVPITDANGHVTRAFKYYEYVHKPNPNPLYWGTNAQTIQVVVGQKVAAGQFIAWSGNTGDGGAGNGLDDSGNPTNTATANTHLHLMTTVPDPRPTNPTDWIQVDPYGIYAKASTGCYDYLNDTPFARLFAPFSASFHNVPVEVLSKYFGYYPAAEMPLQTLSLHRSGGNVLASGSFQHGLPLQWYARFYLTGADFQYWFTYYSNLGYRPREISVTPDSNGDPRFNVIWKKVAGEGYATYFGLTDAQLQQKWDEQVANGKMVPDEHIAYKTNFGTRHAAVFISSPKPAFYEYHYLPSINFNLTYFTLKAQGFQQTNVDVEELSGGTYFGGIWRKIPGLWVTATGLTPQAYQDAFNTYTSQGYRLYRIQGYDDSAHFAAIWTK